ncbi:AAA family ATPase [Pseudonocardia sp. RS11V-5]|uniref:AAA family ATPase n=1 Tax=Pseudonocardia terrae TaxID=2905831 RepID=UPI001E385913|nr:AAA family ATPase [Pseudonocardia terrae]MCE3556209.1 AAA family ATPase [Pseudonocardia terrae]
MREEVAGQSGAPYSDVPYDVIFNDKVSPLLDRDDFKLALSEYTTRLNEILDNSNFFGREAFNYYNAGNVAKSLAENGFFDAKHEVVLHGGDGQQIEVSTKAQLEKMIKVEKEKISDDDALRKKLGAIEKALTKNIDTRRFYDYVAAHPELLPEMSNLAAFREKVWKSYLKKHEDLYGRVVDLYRAVEGRRREIEREAADERTQWERVIEIFNARFFVPFRLAAKNRERVVLGQETILELSFEFEDGAERAEVERGDLLKVLSNGEKKALYILNVLFEVEARKASSRETVFVIDDIADSFDYKNKYAIIQYLKEMADQENFRMIVLTHNFDFFRTLQSRGVVKYKNCLMAQKSEGGVSISQASGIRNPFINDFKGAFYSHGMKRVACIPFIRNIIEYTKGDLDPVYLKLTSLLHWKADTAEVVQSDLDAVFVGAFGVGGAWVDQTQPVVELIFEQAVKALHATEGINFENKIVLSIAIRLRAEQFMVEAISDPTVTDGIEENQTQALYAAYRARGLGSAEVRQTLDSVVLMTPENLHVNSFMYEPIIDMSDDHLRRLFAEVQALVSVPPAEVKV